MHGAMGERSRARANLAFASLERGLSVLIDRRHRVLLARGSSLCGGERAPSPRATGLIVPRPERNGEMRVRNAFILVHGNVGSKKEERPNSRIRVEAMASMRTMSAPRGRGRPSSSPSDPDASRSEHDAGASASANRARSCARSSTSSSKTAKPQDMSRAPPARSRPGAGEE